MRSLGAGAQAFVLPSRRGARARLAAALLAACALASGCGTAAREATVAAQPGAGDWFVDRAADAGLGFAHFNGMSGERDYCSPQVFRAQPDVLYRNRGDGTFADVSAAALTGGGFGPALGVTAADFDGDGWLDVYVANDGAENQLWMNRRDGTFESAAAPRDMICGLYDIQPAFFGLVDNLNTFASNFGEQTEVYNGLDVTVNARLADGAFIAGGVNIGRTATNDCAVRPDSPEARFCAVTPPFLTDLKLSAAYPLPWWDIEFSATIQNSPGSEIGANWTTLPAAANAVWASGGQATTMPFRTFAAGTGARVTVPLIEPGTLYGDRLNQVDFRVSKSIRMDRYNLKVIMDLYNLFNLNPTITFNNTYGSRWQNPFTILPGRFAKFGLQLDF